MVGAILSITSNVLCERNSFQDLQILIWFYIYSIASSFTCFAIDVSEVSNKPKITEKLLKMFIVQNATRRRENQFSFYEMQRKILGDKFGTLGVSGIEKRHFHVVHACDSFRKHSSLMRLHGWWRIFALIFLWATVICYSILLYWVDVYLYLDKTTWSTTLPKLS